jgi:hypothetical protein
MVIVNVKIPKKVYEKMSYKNQLKYEDIIDFYENNSFEYMQMQKYYKEYKELVDTYEAIEIANKEKKE